MTTPTLNRDLLRLASAGSVDDGKSTLIGRLLYDTDSLPADHIESVTRADGALDLAALSDGLRSEREQGITIDVAYRFFSSNTRNYILADTPGHELYTRNMFTGASTADVAIVLVDASKGVLKQTRRHAKIAQLLGVPYIIAAVNKMDIVEYAQSTYETIHQDLTTLAEQLGAPITVVPVVAKDGDNVVHRSVNMPWYTGQTLFEFLEQLDITRTHYTQSYLPIQGVVVPGQGLKRRYIGRVEAGTFTAGDDVQILPSRATSTITSIDNLTNDPGTAIMGQSVSIELADELDVGRGHIIAHRGDDHVIQTMRTCEAMLCWFSDTPLHQNARYILKLSTQTVRAEITDINSALDLDNLTTVTQGVDELALNTIGTATIQILGSMQACLFEDNKTLGSFILIDEKTHSTAAAGFITTINGVADAHNAHHWRSGNAHPRNTAPIFNVPEDLVHTVTAELKNRDLPVYILNPTVVEHDAEYLQLITEEKNKYIQLLASRLADAGIYTIVPGNSVGLISFAHEHNIPCATVSTIDDIYPLVDNATTD